MSALCSSSSRLRLRSRSPNQKRSGTCGIIWDEIGGKEMWTCVVCDAILRVACMPRNDDGRIHLESGCPACRTTLRDALNFVTQAQPAPHGAMCSVCWTTIPHTTPMHSCAAPRWHCIAKWHTFCAAKVRRKCPSCRCTKYEALVMRQQR